MINPLKHIEETHYTLHHPAIDPKLDGARLTQISDIHMGRWVKPHHIVELCEHVNELEPELVLLTGDYVGYDRRDIARCANALATLTPSSFAVLGNHDHWANSELAEHMFDDTPITLLTNEMVVHEIHGVPIHVIGVDDHVTGHANVARAFSRHEPDAAFGLVLNHVPSIAPDCASAGGHLILSGHTHNFQFNIPRFTNTLAARFGVQYYAGPYRLQDAILYINRGLGSASWPWRIRAAPELTHITLRHGSHPIFEFHHASFFGVGLSTKMASRSSSSTHSSSPPS